MKTEESKGHLAAAETKSVQTQKPTATHGFGRGYTDDEGTSREVHCYLFTDKNYSIDIICKAPGIDVATTRLWLSSQGLSLLVEALLLAQHDMHNRPITAKETP